jgi:2-C-methyl-D-erythritol 4-phosphate cytidylyltransferase
MDSATPKQYLLLQGKTVLEHSLNSLLDCPAIGSVVVALGADDSRAAKLSCFSDARVHTAVGGATRGDSVLAALSVVATQASPDDWVLVHDAARPCLAADLLGKLVDGVRANGVGGVLAVPMVDTVKRAGQDGRIRQTLDRSDLWCAQTPQMFRLGLLQSALGAALASGENVTDEASAMELAGHPVQLYPGASNNLKITLPGDLLLAKYYRRAEGSPP